MDEIVVKKDKFEKSLKELEKLNNNQTTLQLPKFQEKSFGIFFPKKVTGAEMNDYTNHIQEALINLNNRTNELYKQFIGVYHTIENLDKEYISGIVGSFNQAIEGTRKAEAAQTDVNKTVSYLEKAVKKMVEFNKKVSNELSIIDSENWCENALKREKELKELDENAEQILNLLEVYKKQYNEMNEFLENNIKSIKKEFDVNNADLKNTIDEFKNINSKIVIDFSNEIDKGNEEIKKLIDSNSDKIEESNEMIEQLIKSNNSETIAQFQNIKENIDNNKVEYDNRFKEIKDFLDYRVKSLYDLTNTYIKNKVDELNSILNNIKEDIFNYYNEQNCLLNAIIAKIDKIDNELLTHTKNNKIRFIFTCIGISISIGLLVVILVLNCVK